MRQRNSDDLFSVCRMLVALTVTALSAGCATAPMHAYPGPSRPSSETATLYVQIKEHARGGIRLTHVDDQEVKGYPVIVLAGEHTLGVKYIPGGGAMFGLLGALAGELNSEKGSVHFPAETNRDYTVCFAKGEGRPVFWVVDRNTGEEVGTAQDAPKTRTEVHKVPVLGSIPLIGWLWRTEVEVPEK